MNKLYIGTRHYSSWSMRGWLAVKMAAIEVEVITLKLAGGNTPEVKAVSPSGTVPMLEYQGTKIWDSLAIIEFCAELDPSLWPADSKARAIARAVSAEMHSGFRDLRSAMPMNLFASHPGEGRTPGALADIARIEQLWADTRARFGGAFLFGDFSAADVMFAPVATRFATYRPEITAASEEYCAAVLAHPLVKQWIDDAAADGDDWKVDRCEAFIPTPK